MNGPIPDLAGALSRRDLLKSGGAMIVGFSLAGEATPISPAFAARGDVAGPPDPNAIDSRIAIHSDNTATLYFGKCELGQGNTTGLLQIAGEELDLDMSQMSAVRLDTNITPDQQATSSSSSIERGGPQVRAAAAVAGATVDFARITTFPNTAAAHRLLAAAAPQLAPQAFAALLQRLFEAYFQRGEDLGSAQTLASIAAEQGVEWSAADASTEPLPPSDMVSGVPFFVFNRQRALSGAQPADVLYAVMQQSVDGVGTPVH